jgi:hypothetical protein
VRFAIDARAPDVPPERALEWWSDFRGGHEDHAFVPGQRRTILESTDEHVTMQDDVRPLGVLLFRERTTAWREPAAVRFEGRNTFSRFRGSYSFVADGEGGTLVRLDAVIELKAVLKAGLPIAKPLVRRILVADLRHHAEEMTRDLAPAAAARS